MISPPIPAVPASREALQTWWTVRTRTVDRETREHLEALCAELDLPPDPAWKLSPDSQYEGIRYKLRLSGPTLIPKLLAEIRALEEGLHRAGVDLGDR